MGGRGGPTHKSINTLKHPVDFLPDVHDPKMILWFLFFFPPSGRDQFSSEIPFRLALQIESFIVIDFKCIPQ